MTTGVGGVFELSGVGVGVAVRFRIARDRGIVTSCIEDVDNRDRAVQECERDHSSLAVADRAQSGPDVISSGTPARELDESLAEGDNRLRIYRAAVSGDPAMAMYR
jgi:hypothetical protein